MQVEILRQSDQELQLILEMYERESTGPRCVTGFIQAGIEGMLGFITALLLLFSLFLKHLFLDIYYKVAGA